MINKVILVGNVGADPEVRHLEQNSMVCTIRLATSETYRGKDGQLVTNTEWHNIVLWRYLAERAEKFVKKGSQLYIEGKLRTRSWDDKEGNKRYTTEIVADDLKILGKRESGESGSNDTGSYHESTPKENSATATQSTNQQTEASDMPEDDLPF